MWAKVAKIPRLWLAKKKPGEHKTVPRAIHQLII
jgi:hypothetical protein